MRSAFTPSAPSCPLQDLGIPIDPASCHPDSLVRSAFTLTPMQAISLTTQRQLALMLRDKVLLKGRIMQVRVWAMGGRGRMV